MRRMQGICDKMLFGLLQAKRRGKKEKDEDDDNVLVCVSTKVMNTNHTLLLSIGKCDQQIVG